MISMETMSAYKGALSDTQTYILWSIGAIGCAFTWFGSISIIVIARRKLTSIYHRLLFVISWVELLINLNAFFTPLMIDKDTGYPLARGNQATCSAIGCLLLFSVVAKAFSSCYISIYFMLSIRYNWKDEMICAYEKFAYLLAFSVPFSFCVVGLVFDFFNPNPARFCSLAKNPIGCNGDECIRGEFAPVLSTVTTSTTVVISVIAIACTLLLYLSVKRQTQQLARHSFAGSINESALKRMKFVQTQAILYVVVFLNNFLWILLFNTFVYVDMDRAIFASTLMLYIFTPSYGFFIYCIYCYPRYGRIRKYFPEKTFFWRMKLLYTKDEGEGEIMARRRCRSSEILSATFDASALALKAKESRDIVLDNSSSFHGSGEKSINNDKRVIAERMECT